MKIRRRAVDDPSFYPLLPVQFRDRLAPGLSQSPEKRLMLAVLADAIVRLYRGGAVRAAEEDWILAPRDASPFAFANICDALDIDATHIARALLASRPPPSPPRVGFRHVPVFRPRITSQRSRRSTEEPRALPPVRT